PIVGTIIGDSLNALGVEPQKDGLEKEYVYPEQPKVEVPDLVGQKEEDLMEYMTNLSIETNGSGNYIIEQSPEAGTKVEQGSTVRIYLDRKSTRLNSSHVSSSYAVFCLKKKQKEQH